MSFDELHSHLMSGEDLMQHTQSIDANPMAFVVAMVSPTMVPSPTRQVQENPKPMPKQLCNLNNVNANYQHQLGKRGHGYFHPYKSCRRRG